MKQITYKEAISFLLPRHYSGRKPSITYAFGYYEDEKLKAELNKNIMNKEAEINKELIKVLKEKIQLLEEQKANNQDIINAQKEQLILSGVSKCLNEQTLENINNIMWESHMIKSKTFDKTQGTMIMQELEKWAGR